MIHQTLSLYRVHPEIRSSLKFVVLCLVRPDLFIIYYCFFYFFKELICFFFFFFFFFFFCLSNFNDPVTNAFQKHGCERKKIVVTSIFSFYHNVFPASFEPHIQWNLVSLKRKGPGFFIQTKVVRTKGFDCVRIYSLPYADLYDRINVACLTVPSI